VCDLLAEGGTVTCTCRATTEVRVRDPVAVVVTEHTDDCCDGERIERERRPIRPSDVLAIEVACAGYRRDHHRTSGELVETNGGRGPRLCRSCWLRWRAEVDR
jgi:hypothetical protein